jgi:hypothetical protein
VLQHLCQSLAVTRGQQAQQLDFQVVSRLHMQLVLVLSIDSQQQCHNTVGIRVGRAYIRAYTRDACAGVMPRRSDYAIDDWGLNNMTKGWYDAQW